MWNWIKSWFYRKPDFIIGSHDNPYMLRWYVIPRNKWFNIYLHKILRSDDDRALHDHPWLNMSLLLSGKYREVTPNSNRIIKAGSVIFRRPISSHRLETVDGHCWSLFITGPTIRTWGFHCPKGWIPWYNFVDTNDRGLVGPGCGE